MKHLLLEDENSSNVIVKRIASLIGNIDPENIKKQLNEFDEDTICEIIDRFLNTTFNPEKYSIDSLKSFLEDKFEYSIIHISEFYKLLSEKFNGKYSSEELELIFDSEKQLICSLLKENDIIETKSILYDKRYDKNCIPIGVGVAPHADIIDVIKQLSITSKLQESK